MVLEHLFPQKWLEHRLKYLFLISVVYSVFSIYISTIIFPKNSGIVSVVLVSLLLIPYIKKAVKEDERKELHERKFNFWHIWNDNKETIKVYLVLFFGIYFSYIAYSFVAAKLGFSLVNVFQEQLSLETSLRGGASGFGLALSILLNNWWVLLVCFLFGLLAGDVALFFVIWNASSWATIFVFRAFGAAGKGFHNPLVNLFILLLITFPHVFLEGMAYVFASISGSEISYDIVSKKRFTKNFIFSFVLMVLGVILIYWALLSLFSSLIAKIIGMFLVILMIYGLSFLFNDEKHKAAFKYAYFLLLLGIIFFLIGVLVEVFVLNNSSLLIDIYRAAMPKGF